MPWTINFISQSDFEQHVRDTLAQYQGKLVPYDLTKLNSNIIDPIKMLFDKNVYGTDWETLITNEIFRQREKAQTNEIGYFHQKIFQYIANCTVPAQGFDVIYDHPAGYKIYAEVKNKHNTTNKRSADAIFQMCQHQILVNGNDYCYLVEAIAPRSRSITWKKKVNGVVMNNSHIKKVSIDRFYEEVTGVPDAFHQICMVLPETIQNVMTATNPVNDTAYQELLNMAATLGIEDHEASIIAALYLLGFGTYNGF